MFLSPTTKGRLVLGLFRGMGRVPLAFDQALGWGLGHLLFWLPTGFRRVTEINLSRCFSDLSEAQRRRLLAATLCENAVNLLEMAWVWRQGLEGLPGRVEFCGGEVLEQALSTGRGVILLGPHLGAWEVFGLELARRWSMTTLYRPPRMAVLDAYIRESRSVTGAEMVPASLAGLRQIRRVLGRGGLVALLPDQEPKRGQGVFAPFFGVPALTMTLAGRLARDSGATVLMGWMERLPGGRYRSHIGPVEGMGSGDPQGAAAAMNRAIEGCVRQQPAQYHWTYRRFRAQPDGRRFYVSSG